MYIPDQPFLVWKATISALHILAIVLSILRLIYRARRNRLWVDDYAMFPVIVLDLMNTIVIWFFYVQLTNKSQLHGKVALFWLSSIPWYTVIWCTRISLTLCITRIFPERGPLRRYARGLAVSWGTLYVGIVAWLASTTCSVELTGEIDPTQANFLNCSYERYGLRITGIAADLFSATVLFFSSIFIICRMTLPKGRKTLALTYLGASGLTLLSGVLYCVFLYSPSVYGPGQPLLIGMSSQIEAAVSIICCNLLAVITYLNRNDRDPDAIDDTIFWEDLGIQTNGRTMSFLPSSGFRSSSKTALRDWTPNQAFAQGESLSPP